ncbi:MAG TPA: hypothetical protein VFQ45_05825 [Longimicrobium sp.]|nr:hypothetical protein [Longimicrobium sp.]
MLPSPVEDGNDPAAQDRAAHDSGRGPVLDHAIRWWNAEEENARRLGRRVNVQLTIVAAFLGLGAFRLLEAHARSPLGYIAKALIIISLVFLVVAPLFMLGILRVDLTRHSHPATRWQRLGSILRSLRGSRPPRALPASSELLLPESALSRVAAPNRADTEYHTAVLTVMAAGRLYRMNLEEEDRIDRGQSLIMFGFGTLLLAMIFHGIAGGIQPDNFPGTVVVQRHPVYLESREVTTLSGRTTDGQADAKAGERPAGRRNRGAVAPRQRARNAGPLP